MRPSQRSKDRRQSSLYWAFFALFSPNLRASQVVLVVKNLPAVQEIWEMCVQSLGWEDLLGEEMATSSSILAWRIAWTEEPGGLQSMGHKESDMTEGLTVFNHN